MTNTIRSLVVAAIVAATFVWHDLLTQPRLYSVQEVVQYGHLLVADGSGSVIIMRSPTGVVAFVRKDGGFEMIVLDKRMKVDKSILKLFGTCV